MNFKYLIMTITFVPFIAQAMENAKKQKRDTRPLIIRRTTSPISLMAPNNSPEKSLLDNPVPKHTAPKNTAPVATHLTSMTTPITFHKKTQSLFEWLRNYEKNKFGDTPVVEMTDRSKVTLTRMGYVRCVNDPDKLIDMLAKQKAIYLSNTEKKHFLNKKYISYGTILVWDDLTRTENKSEIPEHVTYLADRFLASLVIQPNKSLQDKKKEKQENFLEVEETGLPAKKSRAALNEGTTHNKL